jgi:hypothetical protein
MFDFNRWCSWVETQCSLASSKQVTLEFRRGQPSSSQKLMQLSFWETGEADFFGIDLLTGDDIIVFNGRVLDDRSFELTFRECLIRVR